MKKLIPILLVLSMLATLSACGTNAPAPAASAAPAAEAPAAEAPAAEAPAPEETAAPEISWPERTLEIICPYSPGGGSDTMARSLATALENTGKLGQSVIVTNMTGGNGVIGNSYVANKPDDNYVFVTATTGDLGNWCTANAPLTPDNFKPVAMFCWDCYILIVKGDSEYNSIADIIEDSKANPGKVTFAGTGIGSTDNVLYLQMCENYGLNAEFVTFDGGSEIVTSIMGGHVTANWVNPSEAEAYLESGDVKALAVAGEKRLDILPDLPTTVELGFEKVLWRQYRGLYAPQNFPDEYIDKLVGIMEEACTSDFFVNEYLARYGLTPDFRAKGDFQEIIDATWAQFQEIF